MDVRIDTHHVDLPVTGVDTITHRARRAMGRFADSIGRIGLTLRDENGGRGGRDKACVLRVDFRDGGQVVVVERSTSLRRAVIRCLRRGKWLVAREIKRRRAMNRRRRVTLRGSAPDLALQP